MTKKIAQSHQPHANGKHCISIFALNPLPSTVLAAATNPPAFSKRQELVRLREELTDLPQHLTTCWI